MKISIALSPAEIALLPKVDLSDTTAVIFDILRATSTMVTALATGVSAIYPAADLVEALALKQKYSHALLGGERHGEKIDGFDLGNSPLEYLDRANCEIISTTTNGTVAFRSVAHAGKVIAASFLNLSAVASYLGWQRPERLLLVCAGTGNAFASEDALGAGALVSMLSNCDLSNIEMADSATMLASFWKANGSEIFRALQNSENGKRLVAAGRLREVEWCAQSDIYRIVGILSEDAVRSLAVDTPT